MTNPDRTTLPRPEPRLDQDGSDHVAHIVMKDDQMRGYLTGKAITALCGKVWVPSRDYEGLPVCRVCRDERDRISAGMKGLN